MVQYFVEPKCLGEKKTEGVNKDKRLLHPTPPKTDNHFLIYQQSLYLAQIFWLEYGYENTPRIKHTSINCNIY